MEKGNIMVKVEIVYDFGNSYKHVQFMTNQERAIGLLKNRNNYKFLKLSFGERTYIYRN